MLKLSSNVSDVIPKVLKLSSEVSECKPLQPGLMFRLGVLFTQGIFFNAFLLVGRRWSTS